MDSRHISDELKKKSIKTDNNGKENVENKAFAEPLILTMQHQIGNRAVQRLVNRKQVNDELDEETNSNIHKQRGSGLALDTGIQREMGAAMGHDFSNVQIHTSPQADQLNQQLNSLAFTTGNDIFFKQGQYQPGSSSGQELIAHELTHVVQQSGNQIETGQPLSVGKPDDAFEKQADQVSSEATQSKSDSRGQEEEVTTDVQPMRDLQMQEEEEEDVVQTKRSSPSVESEADEEEVKSGQMVNSSHTMRPPEEESPG